MLILITILLIVIIILQIIILKLNITMYQIVSPLPKLQSIVTQENIKSYVTPIVDNSLSEKLPTAKQEIELSVSNIVVNSPDFNLAVTNAVNGIATQLDTNYQDVKQKIDSTEKNHDEYFTNIGDRLFNIEGVLV
jgi:cell division protein FtsL